VLALGGRGSGEADFGGVETTAPAGRSPGDEFADFSPDVGGGFGEDDDTPF
jgi:hypothetical protein